jgi:MOSC domain-containing protein YiiM
VRGPRIVAVCTGEARAHRFGDRDETTAIDKRPVPGPVAVGPEGLDGDVQVDRRFHGGIDRAVYAYAEEDADHWVGALGRDVPPGTFGENLRVRGLDVSRARVGAVWRTSGGVELEVSGPRIPCRTLAGFLDVADMVQRFLSAGRPGAYLRVRVPGAVGAGDRIRVVADGDGPTVAEVMAWRRGAVATQDLRRLADAAALCTDLRDWARETLRDR